MSKEKKNCMNCSNKVGSNYCTMQKDMSKAMFKRCDGFTQAPNVGTIKKTLTYEERLLRQAKREMRSNKGMADENFNSDYLRFLKTGGAWSIRTDKKFF